jgi:NAD-specific glutamate dehydrogenase
MHTGVGRVTRVSWLLDRIEDLERRSGWERIAVEALFLELLGAQRAITHRLLQHGSDTDAVDAFCREHAHTLDTIHESAREIDAEEVRSLPPLTVVAQMIRRLA